MADNKNYQIDENELENVVGGAKGYDPKVTEETPIGDPEQITYPGFIDAPLGKDFLSGKAPVMTVNGQAPGTGPVMDVSAFNPNPTNKL